MTNEKERPAQHFILYIYEAAPQKIVWMGNSAVFNLHCMPDGISWAFAGVLCRQMQAMWYIMPDYVLGREENLYWYLMTGSDTNSFINTPESFSL